MSFNIIKFLKPDWKKILIFILIAVLAFTIGYNSNACASCCPSWTKLLDMGCIAVCCPYFNPIFFPITLLIGSFNIFGVVFVLFSFIYWYLISCLVIFIYNKFKKKRKH